MVMVASKMTVPIDRATIKENFETRAKVPFPSGQ